MRHNTLIAPALGLALLPGFVALAADADLHGRWEGHAAVPQAPMSIVLDLAPQDGRLAGWLTLPGRGTKGQHLGGVMRDGSELRLDLTPAFSQMGPPKPAPQLVLSVGPAGLLQGHFEQGGHRAPVVLLRSGAAQPEPVERNSRLTPALVGTWKGSYELAGQPRQVTLTLAPDSAEMVIVGRRTTKVPIDVVRLGPNYLTLASREMQITVEGRWRTAGGEYDAVLSQGPYEAPLVLRKEAAQ